MDKVIEWGKNRMQYARDRYADFRKKTADMLDVNVQRNQKNKNKLNELLKKTEAEKTAIKEKYAMLRSTNK